MESPEVRTGRPSGSPPAPRNQEFDPSGPAEDAAPADPADPVAPRLTVAVVARRVGVAPATLRTWDRRYGLGPSEHTAGAHRRYTATDVARLEAMSRLTRDGVAPAEAARVVLAAADEALADPPEAVAATRTGRRGGPGGRVLPLPGANATVRGLGRAAMALDVQAVTATVRDQVAQHGVVAAWDEVLRPVLQAVGDRWAATGEGVEVEHLLSDCVIGVLREVAGRARERSGARPVLLACAPQELHALPLHALAAGLAETGVASRMLGAAMPAAALVAAVRRTGPAALFLWSQLPGTADPVVLSRLPATRPPTTVVVGGPGWVPEQLPQDVRFAPDLRSAVALAAHA